MLVEYYHAEGNMQQSYVLIEKMQERKIIINPYLDTELVSPLYASCPGHTIFTNGASLTCVAVPAVVGG